MKTYNAQDKLAFAYKHEEAGKPLSAELTYIGQGTRFDIRDVIRLMDEINIEIKRTSTLYDSRVVMCNGKAFVIPHTYPSDVSALRELLAQGKEVRLAYRGNSYSWSHEYATDITSISLSYVRLLSITDEKEVTIDVDSIFNAHHQTLGCFTEDHKIRLDDEFLAQFGERTRENKAYHPRSFKCVNGVMPVLEFAKFYRMWQGVDVLGQPEQDTVKNLQSIVDDKPYYVYLAHERLRALALYTHEVTRTSSCMYTPHHTHILDHAVRNFKVDDEFRPGKQRVLHPFDLYEISGHGLFLISDKSPAELDRKLFTKFPFVARAFTNADGEGYTDVYGQELMEPVLKSAGLGSWQGDELYSHIHIALNYNDEYIIPYIDNLYDEDIGTDYSSKVTKTGRFAGIKVAVAYIGDEKSYHSYDYIIHRTGRGIAEEQPKQQCCAIEDNWYDEENMIYVADLGAWVHYSYAKYTDEGWVLDGLEVYRYYN